MKSFTILIFLTTLVLKNVTADDVEYSVVAFPTDKQSVSVSVGGKSVPLKRSPLHPNIFSGSAPYGDTYRYIITDGTTDMPEETERRLLEGAKSTGNEFFGRSQTLYDIPALPQAFNPIYPTLFTNLNKSNEIATIIMVANTTQLEAINKAPSEKLDPVLVSSFAYISNKEVYTLQNVGLSTSGQSTKDFAKQSYVIDFNKFVVKGSTKSLLFGRTSLKLRAEETDATFVREKLALDMIAASGGASPSSSWVRVFINGEPYGLFLLTDDLSTHFIDAVLHAGNFKNPTTGVTYKGNAISPSQEGNLAYAGVEESNYSHDLYKLADTGEDQSISKKSNPQKLITEFIKRLNQVNVQEATDAQHPGAISQLINPQHTLIHMAINFLIGSWDGFWYQASNYYLHNELSTNTWTLITYDFDETYGNYLEDRRLNTVPYKNYARPESKRPLVEVFLNNSYYDHMFQETLKTIVKRFFKPSIINPRLHAWSKMLEEDIKWTRSIHGRSPGTTTAYTLNDFENGLTGNSTDSINLWIKNRVESLTAQLHFSDKDDLPPLPAYTEGAYMDTKGVIAFSNGSTVSGSNRHNVFPGGNTNNGYLSYSPTHIIFTIIIVIVFAIC